MKKFVVLFDFDGTLCNTESVMVPSFNELSKKYGFKGIASKEEADYLKSISTKERLEYAGIKMRDLPMILVDFRNKMSEKTSEFTFFEGVQEELKKLKEHNVALGILSSNKKENIFKIVKNVGAFELFSYFDSGMSFFGKSSRLIKLRKKIMHDFSKLGSGADDLHFFYVGDEARDIEAAKEAGYSSVAVSWGHYSKNLLESSRPDIIVNDVEKLFHSIVSYSNLGIES